jgi:nucleoside-triphosphatase THEP1
MGTGDSAAREQLAARRQLAVPAQRRLSVPDHQLVVPSRQIVTPPPIRGQIDIQMPERIPWSELRDYFHSAWGRADPADPQPEHMEILGASGSGKTYLIGTVVGERAERRGTAAVLVATKPADETLLKLGWPIVDTWGGVRENRHCIFWPRTSLRGTAKKAYHNQRITDLLHRLWVPDANVIVQFDEIGYLERLSGEMAALVEEYWREARSQKITVMAGKQRPQGANRAMHSESPWTVAFPPADEGDLDRFAELFGPKRIWSEIFRNLDQTRREFLIRHTRTRQTFISWVDIPLRPPRGTGQRPNVWNPRKRMDQGR